MTELLGWWLHIDLDVLDPLEFAARGLPDVEDEPGGLTWTSSPTWCAMLDSGSCICASIAIYDPDQDDDGTGAGQIVTFVRTIVGSYREGR
jgi:arginase